LRGTSAGSIRVIKRHAIRLGLDTSHFAGTRTWSDGQLKSAVVDAQSWDELLAALGLTPGRSDGRMRIKAQAIRLGLDLSRLGRGTESSIRPIELEPDVKYLRDAATSIAASWFALRGFNTAIPMEPAVYDLLVSMSEGIKRIQVKTTTYNGKTGWMVGVGRRPYSIGNKERLVPYDPELIDQFFIVDGDLNMYLIPSQVIAGRVQILLRTYKKYIVGNAAGLMSPRSAAA
jgi:hypothetical protein